MVLHPSLSCAEEGWLLEWLVDTFGEIFDTLLEPQARAAVS